MPAAAVIPAPRAYIKVVAVKKLVVEPWWFRPVRFARVLTRDCLPSSGTPYGVVDEILL